MTDRSANPRLAADFAQSLPGAFAHRKTLNTAPKAGVAPRRTHALLQNKYFPAVGVTDGAFIIATGIGLWFATANPFT